MKSPEGIPQEKEEGNLSVREIWQGLKIIAALGVGGALLSDSPEQRKPFDNIITKTFSSQEFKTKFDVVPQVPGERFVIHIGQLHSRGSLAEMLRSTFVRDSIINSQKEVEQAILKAKEIFGVDTVYAEGFDPDDEAITQINKLMNEFRSSWETKNFRKIVEQVLETASLLEAARGRLEEYFEAYMAYFIVCRVRDLEGVAKQTPGSIDETTMHRLMSLKEKLEKNPLIAGDHIYLYDAPFKLVFENKIKLIAVDDRDALNAFFPIEAELQRHPELSLDDNSDLVQRYVQAHNRREDIALTSALNGLEKSEDSVALITFGNAHDFSGNLLRMKDAGRAKDIGVVKLDSITGKLFVKKVNEQNKIRNKMRAIPLEDKPEKK